MKQLLSEIDSNELSEWMAYDRYVEPLPDLYWAAGMIASIMANLWGKKGRRFKPKDFMPIYRERVQRTPEQDVAILDAMCARQNASM